LRPTRVLIGFVIALTTLSCARAAKLSPSAPAFARTQTVFIGQLGEGPDAALAMSTLQSELTRRGPLRPLADSLSADAILQGSVRVRRPQAPGEDFLPFGQLTLVSRVTRDTLWTHRYIESAPFGIVRRGQAPEKHVLTMVLQFVDRLNDDYEVAARRTH
jgi:hypothetical protein